ncbi:MAG: hypothetical protein LBO73_03365 [Holosporaceae bacterium]|jgi:hypothetical protein|nr:hypothetical protein [Holosporaceae bacterium]
MYYKSFVKIIYLTINIFFLIIIAAIVIFDPLQAFHKSWFYPGKYYTKNIKEASYGIIKYADFDSLIIGSSMANNFSANEASRQLGGNFINLSAYGLSLVERKILLKHLFNVKRPKTIIYSLDRFKDEDFLNNYDKLYGSIFDKVSFYCNNRFVGLVMETIFYRNNLTDNLDCPNAWWHACKRYFGRVSGWIKFAVAGDRHTRHLLKSVIRVMEAKDKINDGDLQSDYYTPINDCLIDFCKKHTQTMFIIFLPPYHKIYWKTESALGSRFELHYTGVKYLLQNTKNYKNIIVFGFDNDSFTTDISRYRDGKHYDEKINSYILNAIREKTHILTVENVDEYFEKMKKDIQHFDLKHFYYQIKGFKKYIDRF